MNVPLVLTWPVLIAAPLFAWLIARLAGRGRRHPSLALAGLLPGLSLAICLLWQKTLLPSVFVGTLLVLIVTFAIASRPLARWLGRNSLGRARWLESFERLLPVLVPIVVVVLPVASWRIPPGAIALCLLILASALALFALRIQNRFAFSTALVVLYVAILGLSASSAREEWSVARWRSGNIGMASVLVAGAMTLRGNPRVRWVLGTPALQMAVVVSSLSLAPIREVDGTAAAACWLLAAAIWALVSRQLGSPLLAQGAQWIAAVGVLNLVVIASPSVFVLLIVPLLAVALCLAASATKRLARPRMSAALLRGGTMIAVCFALALLLAPDLLLRGSWMAAAPLALAAFLCVPGLRGIARHAKELGALLTVRAIAVFLIVLALGAAETLLRLQT